MAYLDEGSCMATPATLVERPVSAKRSYVDQHLVSTPGRTGVFLFALISFIGIAYIAIQVHADLAPVHYASASPYLLLGLALAIALGFEFVNGFHDTANAVATVIYTNSMGPQAAVVFSGLLNFIGVLFSSGTVAFAIISLLPVELILKANDGAGFAMIFALLISAMLWNLATWHRGLPASSSHTMIGSIVGVGVAYHLMDGRGGTAGVNWEQVKTVFEALFFSPLIGFVLAAVIFALFKLVARDPRLYKAPEGAAPPPFYIRLMLILMCGGVSYAHGQNDGQKGMGLIMLILVGTVPAAYALNHAMGADQQQSFTVISTQATAVLDHYIAPGAKLEEPRTTLELYVRTGRYQPEVMPALRETMIAIRGEVMANRALASLPQNESGNIRNQMYLAGETLRLLMKPGDAAPKFSSADVAALAKYQGFLDKFTRFIPNWVKVAVALALGMGTMIGWKRIVVTVGEKIGKTRMSYAQGAAAQLVAMVTILGAGDLGLPVSTTHVLSSSVAGSMSANGSGLQRITVRNIVIAWIFTLPAAALLSAGLYWAFHMVAR